MHDDHHDHDHHDHDHGSELSPLQARVRALETVLTDKGYIDPAALDLIVETTRPRSARATAPGSWRGPGPIPDTGRGCSRRHGGDRRARLLRAPGRAMVALENTGQVHNIVVCTLCSCYPMPVLGLPPVWYKAAPYRSRAVLDPRGVLADFGVDPAAETRGARLGLDGRDALSRHSRAPRRHRRLVRGATRQSRHPRQHDRHRPCARSGSHGAEGMNGAQDMGGVRASARSCRRRTSRYSTANGRRACWRWSSPWATPAAGHRSVRSARENWPPPAYRRAAITRSGWPNSRAAGRTRAGLTEEIAAGHAVDPAKPVARVLKPEAVTPMLSKGAASERPSPAPARFAVGARVRARNMHPAGHTRLPRYVRGHVGVITQAHGAHVFPDVSARGEGEAPQWLYTVRFSARELWGEAADPAATVSVDAWESYLEPAA